MNKITVDSLRAVKSLEEVPEDQLQWFITQGKVLQLQVGEYIFKPGDLIPGPFVILAGKVMLCIPVGAEMQEVGVYETGAIGGNLPFSRGKIANVITEVVEDLTYLQFPLDLLPEMIRSHFNLTQALVHVMANRIREYTAFEQQSEKMMALGKLSAGLAHELNNPAAAVVRGSATLLTHLKNAPEIFRQIILHQLDVNDLDYIIRKIFGESSKPEKPGLSMIERSSLEDDLLDWLDEQGVADPADTAEVFVDFGIGISDLDELRTHIPAEAIPAVFNWIRSNLLTEKIVMDMKEASGRISDLVGSVKTFTHMDQGHGKKYADIHIGIRNTLTMLQHKIRNGNVKVIEHFDTTLPEVNAQIGELNQVWTNILDNALDAMEPNGNGELVITTGRAKDCVRVTVTDNGPGIPEDVKSRMFDPFFTTKPMGKGTGLGLDVVMRIVRQHKGAVKVRSHPGQTEIIVEFPING